MTLTPSQQLAIIDGSDGRVLAAEQRRADTSQQTEKQQAQQCVRRFLDLSTGHLTQATRDLLENHCGPSTIYDHPEGEGWLVHVPEPDVMPPEEEVPADLQACMAKARELGCDYILFDTAGPDCLGLEWFDDEGADPAPECDEDGQPICTNPGGHEFQTDIEEHERCLCIHCGADGDA